MPSLWSLALVVLPTPNGSRLISSGGRKVRSSWAPIMLCLVPHGIEEVASQSARSDQSVSLHQPHFLYRGLGVRNLDPHAVHCRVNILGYKTFHRSRRS